MNDYDKFFDASVGEAALGEGTACSVSLPDDPVLQDAWRRGVARLAGIRHEHVVPVLRTRAQGRELRVHHDLAAGSLPARDWIPAGTALTPGEIVTLGAGLARGLAALHREGVCRHGALRLDDVVIDSEGRPRWRLSYAVPRGQAEEADDVAALAALLRELIADRAAPGPLTLALLRAEDEDPRRRPNAAAFADMLVAACTAEPLRLPAVSAEPVMPAEPIEPIEPVEAVAPTDSWPRARAPQPQPLPPRRPVRSQRPEPPVVPEPDLPEPSRRRPRVRALAIGVVGMVALVGLVRGTAVAARGDSPTVIPSAVPSLAAPIATPEPSETPSATAVTLPADPSTEEAWGASPEALPQGDSRAPDLPWAAVLAALDAARVDAFTRGDPSALTRADAPGSPALESDSATIAALRSAGLTPRGFGLTVVSASEVGRDAANVVLRVVDKRPAYDLVDAKGAVRETRPARPDSAWLVTLVRAGSPVAWRVRDVRPTVGGGSTNAT